MSGSVTVVPLTDAEKVQVLYYCGYPSYGTEVTTYDPFGLYFPAFNQPTPVFPERMVAVLATIRAKLAELVALDAGVTDAASRLSTASAAVWTRNSNEVADRTALVRQRGRDLCALLDVPPGPRLGRVNNPRLVV